MISIVEKPFQKGYKFPIYPNEDQVVLLERTFGCCRYVYNKTLQIATEEYEVYRTEVNSCNVDKLLRPRVSGYDFVTKLPLYKVDPETAWLSEVSSIALQQALLNLGKSFQHFLKEKKGYPRFKKKREDINPFP